VPHVPVTSSLRPSPFADVIVWSIVFLYCSRMLSIALIVPYTLLDASSL